jgi:hypothetical protein
MQYTFKFILFRGISHVTTPVIACSLFYGRHSPLFFLLRFCGVIQSTNINDLRYSLFLLECQYV